MPVTVAEIVTQMRQALSLSEPDLDTSIGTPTRKILDAVGEVIAESYVDRYVLDYQYDIDSKMGDDLDDFVALLGFTRFAAKRATGTVTFERTTPATENILIAIGTQVATEGTSPVVFATMVPALMLVGDTSISVPVQAVLGGSDGNVAANAIRRRVTPFDGINSFTNSSSLSGGADAESDEQLRTRFKRTVFRNLAGTEQMYLGVALDDESVTQANVLGSVKRRREQIQLVGGVATSTGTGIKKVFATSIFGSNIDEGLILTPNVHYTFTTSIPPSITRIDATAVPDGVYDLEYEYVPSASRNNPDTGITNRVDVYVNGDRATEATEVALFRTARLFNNTSGDSLLRTNFLRDATGVAPTNGNYFIQLAFAPVSALPDTLVINGQTYTRDTDYWLVNDITSAGLTPSSMSGIEFKSAANGQVKPIPANNTPISIEYFYNAVPRDVESDIRAWKLLTTDVKVHQAKKLLLNLFFAVILQPGYTSAAVEIEIMAALSDHIAGIGFNGVVQVSDLLDIAHRVPGVDAIRFLTSVDNATNYAIQRINQQGTVLTTYSSNTGSGTMFRATDVLTADDEVPVLNDVTLVLKAQNTFGAV